MDRSTMENQLFTWDGWDDNGPGDMSFSDVELKVPVGDFPAGTKFPVAVWMGSASLLLLIDENQKEFAYELNISVGAQVDPTTLHNHGDSCDCGHEH